MAARAMTPEYAIDQLINLVRGFYFVVLPTLLLAAVVCSAYWGTSAN